MKITIDTNPLVRFIIRDDHQQAAIVSRWLNKAAVIAVTVPTWCEFVWVLRHSYRMPRQEILLAIQSLLQIGSVTTDRLAVEAGLGSLQAGRDFADGVIAFQGRRLGGEVFLSFDKKAVTYVRSQGYDAHLV